MTTLRALKYPKYLAIYMKMTLRYNFSDPLLFIILFSGTRFDYFKRSKRGHLNVFLCLVNLIFNPHGAIRVPDYLFPREFSVF